MGETIDWKSQQVMASSAYLICMATAGLRVEMEGLRGVAGFIDGSGCNCVG